MAELTDEHKQALVVYLARYLEPAQVAVAMKAEFELDLTIAQICKYDPTKSSFTAGEKWLEIFTAARETHLKDVAAVPVSNQAYRLNVLQDGIVAAVKDKKWALAAQLTEQAAKEMGGVFTNVRDLNVNNRVKASDLTDEERRELLVQKVIEAMEKPPVALATDPAPARVQ